MERIGKFIVRWRRTVSVILTLMVLFLGWRASKLRENLSFETLYLSGDSEIGFSERFAEEFENINDMTAVAITGDDIFSPELLTAVSGITHKLEKLRYVDSVKSIANIRYIQGRGEDLDVVEFLKEIPQNSEEEQYLREKAMDYPLFQGRLISRDGKYTAIVVQTENVVGASAAPEIELILSQVRKNSADQRVFTARQLLLYEDRLNNVLNLPRREIEHLIKQMKSSNITEQVLAANRLAETEYPLVRRMTVGDRRELIHRIEHTVRSGLPSGYTAYITGTNAVERDYYQILNWDRLVFNGLAIIAIGIMFYVFFRSIRDVCLALVTLLLSSVCSLGLIQVCGGEIDIIGSFIITMVLVVGTSDAVYMITGFYQFRKKGIDPELSRKAAADMVRRQGFACLMTSLTTAAGFFSLYAAKISTISRFGLHMAISILMTYGVSLVTLTILLSFVQTVAHWRRDAPGAHEKQLLFPLLCRSAFSATASPVKIVLILCVCLSVGVWGISKLEVESRAVSELSEDSPTKKNIRIMENLAGFIGFEVSIQTKEGHTLTDPLIMKKIDSLCTFISEQTETIETWSFVDYLKFMNQSAQGGQKQYYTVPNSREAAEQFILFYSFSSEGRKEFEGLLSKDRTWTRIVSRVYDLGAKPYLALKKRVERMGDELFSSNDIEVRVTSESYLLHAAMDRLVNDLSRSICWAFLFVSLIMIVVLKSFLGGLITLIPNIFPVIMTLSFMGLTGIPLRVGTVVVFSLGLGIAVDDTIHYVLRYRKKRVSGCTHEKSVHQTHLEVGLPMVQTSVVLMTGFGVMGFATFKSISHMGILNCFTIGVALLGDLFITPLLLKGVCTKSMVKDIASEAVEYHSQAIPSLKERSV